MPGESPPPERVADKQMHATPASGKGTDDASNKEQTNKDALSKLTSNPKGPLDDIVTQKFAKTASESDSKTD
ncbi:hypothetical protein B0H63DRAFT_524376 [Podospora didyma]|uniref:Uncharacterized protein n=1 Tax=Podospora didyma TaxID=330526 RepID=A0AAE0TW54_9PEZI|nr:hypothetical protein B0H63DRAFT_524376 [Podospora didyma]